MISNNQTQCDQMTVKKCKNDFFGPQGVETGELASKLAEWLEKKWANGAISLSCPLTAWASWATTRSRQNADCNKKIPAIPTKKLFTCLPLFGQETLISQSCPGKKMASYGWAVLWFHS